VQSFGMHLLLSWEKKDGVSTFLGDTLFPLGKVLEFFNMTGTHWYLRLESFMSFIYFVIVSSVMGWTTPLHTSLRSRMC